MKKSKKMILSLMLCLFTLVMLVGCSTSSSKTFTFSVDNGDAIKVSIDTSDSYNLSSDLPFVISCEGNTLSQGIFIYSEIYEQYVYAAQNDDKAVILDSGTKDGNEYVFWSYNNAEYNYAIRIAGSKTGVLLGNNVSEASARECFERLTISVAD